MRSQSVPAWEVAAQLGHKAPEYSTTEIYAPFDPSYLEKSCAAIDEFFVQLCELLNVENISEYLLKNENCEAEDTVLEPQRVSYVSVGANVETLEIPLNDCNKRIKLVPRGRIELPTSSLPMMRSTTELPRLFKGLRGILL